MWETDRSYPDIGSILKLSDLYGLSLDELLKEDTHMRKHMETTANLMDELWNGLFVTAVLLLPLSMLLQYWNAMTLGVAARVASMALMITVLFTQWKLKGWKWPALALGVLFALILYIPGFLLLAGSHNNALGIPYEYIAFGVILLYSHGVIFKTRLAFWQTIALYFGVPVYVAVSTALPVILEDGPTIQFYDPFGAAYQTEVMYQTETPPASVLLDSDGTTLILEGEEVGGLELHDERSFSNDQFWYLVPSGEEKEVILLTCSHSGDEIVLEYRCYDTGIEQGEAYDLLWMVRLIPAEEPQNPG